MHVGYSNNFKDSLVVLNALQALILPKPELGNNTSNQAVYQDWLDVNKRGVSKLIPWATSALDEIRGEDQVSRKHSELTRDTIEWQLAFFNNAMDPICPDWKTQS